MSADRYEVACRIIAGESPPEQWEPPWVELAHMHTGSGSYYSEVARMALGKTQDEIYAAEATNLETIRAARRGR